MIDFPGRSVLLKRHHKSIVKALEDAVAFAPETLYSEYRTKIERSQNSSESPGSHMRWLLFHYFLFSGFFQGFLHMEERPVFTFGAGVLPWDLQGAQDLSRPTLPGNYERFTVVHEVLTKGDESIQLEGVIPRAIEAIVRKISRREILPMALNYFRHMPGIQEKRSVDLIGPLEEKLVRITNESFQAGESVTFTHFLFQEMTVFFELAGEYRSQEILETIEKTIMDNMRPGDHIFEISPTSFLVVSPGSRIENIKERFHNIYFQVHSLVLDYKIHQKSISAPPLRLQEIWKDLKL